jgi:RNA polymerase sigma factor (sigma-70 family)
MTDQKETLVNDSIQQFGGKLFGFIRKRVRNEEDAEDILQDVWYQLSNFANVADLENVGAWLYRVARNRVTDRYRKKTTDSLEDFGYQNDDEEVGVFKELLLLDDTNNPELALFKENFWEELMEALAELPEKQREVFILNEIDVNILNIQKDSVKLVLVSLNKRMNIRESAKKNSIHNTLLV